MMRSRRFFSEDQQTAEARSVKQLANAKRQQEEFAIITNNMSEGLLVIDKHTATPFLQYQRREASGCQEGSHRSECSDHEPERTVPEKQWRVS